MKNSSGLGPLMLDVQGLQLSAADRDVLCHPQTGGVILGLYGRNYESLNQLRDLVAGIRECNPQLLIAVDQEGGRVQRFKQDFTRLPSMHTFGELYARDRQQGLSLAETCGWLMAAEVLACGLDLSFAPVLDLYRPESRIIADRAFAAVPDDVVSLANAFIAGMHAAGMKATGKHFPGHGSVPEDSHVELPIDNRSLEELEQSDLLPFSRCVDNLDAVMPGHVVYTQIDEQCAALSPAWLQDVLRYRLGFKGIIFSDDLTMAAADSAGDMQRRAHLALDAGCDMVLVCNDRPRAEEVLHWLESQSWPGNAGLTAMAGERRYDWEGLHESAQWRAAREQIAPLTAE
ncbi:MAG: beta-N-acetylhexosaminidase [Gammaproteobacteria bacterium]